jgi:hypothetical protein
MNKVEAVSFYIVKGRGIVISTYSPVICFRSTKAFIEANGPEIEINNVIFKIEAVEMFMPGRPLAIGEPIGILIKHERN